MWFMKLKRSNDRYLGGVCGGIAEYFNLNPYLIRIIWVVLSLVSAVLPGLVVYIILWIVMQPPEE